MESLSKFRLKTSEGKDNTPALVTALSNTVKHGSKPLHKEAQLFLTHTLGLTTATARAVLGLHD